MKIRKGFVSNSSSSSFLIYGAQVDMDELTGLATSLEYENSGKIQDFENLGYWEYAEKIHNILSDYIDQKFLVLVDYKEVFIGVGTKQDDDVGVVTDPKVVEKYKEEFLKIKEFLTDHELVGIEKDKLYYGDWERNQISGEKYEST